MAKKPFKKEIKDFSGGINTSSSTVRLPDNQFVEARNLDFRDDGSGYKRTLKFDNRSGSSTDTCKIIYDMAGKGLYRFKADFSGMGSTETPIEGSYSYVILMTNSVSGAINTACLSSTSSIAAGFMIDQTWTNIFPESTSGEGYGARFDFTTDGSGVVNDLVVNTTDGADKGIGYKTGDSITIRDPYGENHNNTFTITLLNVVDSTTLTQPIIRLFDESQEDDGTSWGQVSLGKFWRSPISAKITQAPTDIDGVFSGNVSVPNGQRITAASAGFITSKVRAGDILTNTDNGIESEILSVLSETELEVRGEVFISLHMAFLLTDAQKEALSGSLTDDFGYFNFGTGNSGNLVTGDASGFTATDATFINFASGSGRIDNTTTSTGKLTMPITTVVGKKYDLSVSILFRSAGNLKMSLGADTNFNSSNSFTSSGNRVYNISSTPFEATGTTSYLVIETTSTSSSAYYLIDHLQMWSLAESFSIFKNPVPDVYSYGNGLRISDTTLSNNNPSLTYRHIKRDFFGEGIEYDRAPAYSVPTCALGNNSWELYEQELKAPTIIKMDACYDLLGQVRKPNEIGLYVHEPYKYESGILEEGGITDYTHNPGDSVMWMDALSGDTFSENDKYAFTYIYDGVQESELSKNEDGDIGISGFNTIQTKAVENKPATYNDAGDSDVEEEVIIRCLTIYTKGTTSKSSYSSCLISLNSKDATYGSHKTLKKGDVLRISSELVKIVKVVGVNIHSAGNDVATFQVLRGIHGTTPVDFEGHDVYIERPPQKARAINIVLPVLKADRNTYVDCRRLGSGGAHITNGQKTVRFHINPYLGIYGRINKKWQDWWGQEPNYLQGVTWCGSDAAGGVRSYQTPTDNEYAYPGSGIIFKFDMIKVSLAADVKIHIRQFHPDHRKYATPATPTSSTKVGNRSNKIVWITLSMTGSAPENPTIYHLRDVINHRLPTAAAGTYNTGGAGMDIGFAGAVENDFINLADFVTVSAPMGDDTFGGSMTKSYDDVWFDSNTTSNDFSDFNMPFSLDKRITGINLYWNPKGETDWYLVNTYDVNKGYSETPLAKRSIDAEDSVEGASALEFIPGKDGHQVQSDFGRWIECPYWVPHSSTNDASDTGYKLIPQQLNNGVLKFDRNSLTQYQLEYNITPEDIILMAPIGEFSDGDKFDNSDYTDGGHRKKLKFNQLTTTYCKAANVYNLTEIKQGNSNNFYKNVVASLDTLRDDVDMILAEKNRKMTTSGGNDWVNVGVGAFSLADDNLIVDTTTADSAQGVSLAYSGNITTPVVNQRYLLEVRLRIEAGTGSEDFLMTWRSQTWTLHNVPSSDEWETYYVVTQADVSTTENPITITLSTDTGVVFRIDYVSIRACGNRALENTLSWGTPYVGNATALGGRIANVVNPISSQSPSTYAKVSVSFKHIKQSNGLQYIEIPNTSPGGSANTNDKVYATDWGWYFRGNYIIICHSDSDDDINRVFPDERYGIYKIASDGVHSENTYTKIWIDPSYKEIPAVYNALGNDENALIDVYLLPTKIPVNHVGTNPSTNPRMGLVYDAQAGVGSGSTRVVQLESLPDSTFGTLDAETVVMEQKGYEAIVCRPRGDAVTTMYMPFDGYRGLTYQGLTERAATNKIRRTSWVSSEIINAMAVIGGVDLGDDLEQRQKEKSRIMWTLPNRFDEFTFFRSRDIGTRDGDEIVDITSWNGALVVMKKNNIYIIDPTQGFREVQRVSGVGLSFKNAYCKSPYGVIVVHKTGVYIVPDKKELTINIRNKALEFLNYSGVNTNNQMVVPIVNFNTRTNELFLFFDTANINQTSGEAERDTTTNFPKGGTFPGYTGGMVSPVKDLWVYNFDRNSWNRRNVNIDQTHSDESSLSNFVQTDDDGLLIASNKHGSSTIILKKSSSVSALSAGQGHCSLKSKDYTFGNDDTFKYIKNMYITYKSNSGIGLRIYSDGELVKEINTSSGISFRYRTKKFQINVKCKIFKYEIFCEGLVFDLDDIVIEGYDTGKAYGAYETTGL